MDVILCIACAALWSHIQLVPPSVNGSEKSQIIRLSGFRFFFRSFAPQSQSCSRTAASLYITLTNVCRIFFSEACSIRVFWARAHQNREQIHRSDECGTSCEPSMRFSLLNEPVRTEINFWRKIFPMERPVRLCGTFHVTCRSYTAVRNECALLTCIKDAYEMHHVPAIGAQF